MGCWFESKTVIAVPLSVAAAVVEQDIKTRGITFGANLLRAGMQFFGLVSLFNGISPFVGYLMLKLSFLKDSSGTI